MERGALPAPNAACRAAASPRPPSAPAASAAPQRAALGAARTCAIHYCC